MVSVTAYIHTYIHTYIEFPHTHTPSCYVSQQNAYIYTAHMLITHTHTHLRCICNSTHAPNGFNLFLHVFWIRFGLSKSQKQIPKSLLFLYYFRLMILTRILWRVGGVFCNGHMGVLRRFVLGMWRGSGAIIIFGSALFGDFWLACVRMCIGLWVTCGASSECFLGSSVCKCILLLCAGQPSKTCFAANSIWPVHVCVGLCM